MYHTCTVTCTVHLYCTVHCTHQHGLGHGGPDYDQPGAAGQVQQRRDVPAQRGRHQVPHNVLRAVTLSHAANIDDAMTQRRRHCRQ